jgi:5'-3' exonuclease
MGIPSYFSYIVRNHRAIIKKFTVASADSPKINNLYLDCNSFIYEAHHNLSTSKAGTSKAGTSKAGTGTSKAGTSKAANADINFSLYEETIIKEVCECLIKMIRQLQPNKRILIAFDGVAPMAKLNQQRNRRYMAAYQNSLSGKPGGAEWNTASITPGTAFMERLGDSITKRFQLPSEFGLEEIIVSSSAEPGEGEHKIYDYIRTHKDYHRDTQTIIYGLDADLIMLTLNHLHISENMYLYRETPEFIKTIDKTLNPNENYLLDIPLFAKSIINELATVKMAPETMKLDNDILFDYILLCFFLGNDFLPHFPALNIRTTGINDLINAYKFVFNDSKETLTHGREINWKNMRKFIAHLALNELDYIKEEYVQRDKLSKRLLYQTGTGTGTGRKGQGHMQEDENLLLPLKERAHELYINPQETGWESRYYKVLFNTAIDDDRRNDICTNYLEGLEWTMKYYSTGCADWRWLYHYHYPPLLVDLIKYVPHAEYTFVPLQPKQPVSPLVQLSYVLPPASMGLIPYALHKKLLAEQPEWYVIDNYMFLWAFCKFFWEAHVELPHIDMPLLESLVKGEI